MRRQQRRADEALWRAVEEMAAGLKKLPRDLLVRLKELLVLDWRKKSGARSQLKLAIEEALDAGLPSGYTPELYKQKCSAVFEHVYESFLEPPGAAA